MTVNAFVAACKTCLIDVRQYIDRKIEGLSALSQNKQFQSRLSPEFSRPILQFRKLLFRIIKSEKNTSHPIFDFNFVHLQEANGHSLSSEWETSQPVSQKILLTN